MDLHLGHGAEECLSPKDANNNASFMHEVLSTTHQWRRRNLKGKSWLFGRAREGPKAPLHRGMCAAIIASPMRVSRAPSPSALTL